MSDSFEFTLHSPLTKEDWNKISDVEHENTIYVTFQTPQGRQVKYIKCEVLDKIRAEIEQIADEEQNHDKKGRNMDWVYERLDKLVESGEMTEEEARIEYREYKEAQAEEYMNECVYSKQF